MMLTVIGFGLVCLALGLAIAVLYRMIDGLMTNVANLAAEVAKLKAAVEDVKKTAEAVQDRKDEENRQARLMDEGFENLMTYAVSLGHGKKTGGDAN